MLSAPSLTFLCLFKLLIFILTCFPSVQLNASILYCQRTTEQQGRLTLKPCARHPSGVHVQAGSFSFFFAKRTSRFPKQNPTQMADTKWYDTAAVDGVGRGAQHRAEPRGWELGHVLGCYPLKRLWEAKGQSHQLCKEGADLSSQVSCLLPHWCWDLVISDRTDGNSGVKKVH